MPRADSPDTSGGYSLDAAAAHKLATLEAKALRRTLKDTTRDGIVVERDGRRLLSFSCNDYLDLGRHPLVKQAAIAALQKYGVGAGASRLVTGNHPLYAEIEAKLAALKGTEAAVVFGSGYLANTGIIPTLIGRNDAIFVDELAHNCILAGAKMSGAATHIFRHNDMGHLASLLAAERAKHRHAMIATDGVFSMDGDLAPLPALAALAEEHDSWLMADDAHGVGVVGGGRGSTFAFTPKPNVPLQMGTLSKAVGGYGGYLCASRAVVDLMKTRAATLVYSTGLPPATIAAAIAALDIIATDAATVARPLAKARIFTSALGLAQATSAIVPVVLGDAKAALAAAQLLEDEGFLVAAIRPPTVPIGTARLRFTFSAAHDDADIQRLAAVVAQKVLRP
ncbi:MAG: 8-amino-7-oxononanoate synthase [Rhodospirillaceae bacterium]